MKKLSSFISESNKKDFTKKLSITLDNGTVLEAKITISDLNETFAKSQISEKISNKRITNLSFVDSNETIVSENISDVETIVEAEYYSAYSSIFESVEYRYDFKLKNSVFENHEDVLSTYKDKQFGWENEPSLLIVKFSTNPKYLEASIKNLQEKLKNTYGSPFVRLTKKDW